MLAALESARERGLVVVISGSRHSQGGHIVYPGALLLDMSGFNQVISLSPENRTITVQSGVTWSQIQQAINPHGLAIKVMQSSNIFTVGGSLGANVHGRDPRHGPLIETVRRLKIALPGGEVVVVSRQDKADLFQAVIGGYGLLGIILEAEIELTENLELIKSTVRTDYADYAAALTGNLDRLSLHFGRCSFIKDETFLRECYSINFHAADSTPVSPPLKKERRILFNSLFFNFSRNSSIGKKIRWSLQKKLNDVPGEALRMSRNNAMRPAIAFLEYQGQRDTDILQEYFVPLSRFTSFMDGLRQELINSDVNLLSITLRYLGKNDESILNYASREMIAIVLYINIGTDAESIEGARAWTRRLVALALENDGNYYLTYQRFPTLEQFRAAYPGWWVFNRIKCKYDPQRILMSKFYAEYFLSANDDPASAGATPAAPASCG